MYFLPIALRPGKNFFFRAAILTIVNCQELVNTFQKNVTILKNVAAMIPGMSSEEYKILLRHRKLLSRVMYRISTTLQV
jgi:hypothetical protein